MSQLFKEVPGDEGLPGPQRRLAALVVVLATLMAVLDLGIVNIALPSMAGALGVSASQAVWVATVYQLVCAAALLCFAALSRVLGHRRIFAAGILLFSLGSLGAALSLGLESLLAFRAIQGLGAAAILSLGPSLYRVIFPRRLLGRAIGLNAMVVAVGLASGPSLGGLVLAIASWPWVFALNVPTGIVALWLAWRALPRESLCRGHFDWPGALFSASMMAGFLLAVERLGHGESLGIVIGLSVASLVAAGLFIRRQARAPSPLVPPSLFAAPRFTSASVVTALAFTGQGAVFVALPFLYQSVMGATPLQAALLFTPWPLALLLSGPVAGRLADGLDPARLSAGGLALFLVGMASLAWLSMTKQVAYLVVPSLLCGLGYGFFQAPNNREIMGSVPLAMSANASGVLAAVRTFGQCLGTALVALMMALPFGSVQGALWLATAVALVAWGISVRRLSLPVDSVA
ncbi:MFS transporter [Halomonas sp. LN1S58]|uniref:MFS transporter n=1 Tax=Halomonas kalidii TaxID=3043293 RepID=A0ABT6VPG5_9GAMM|nr:MFS transporter [Halomonas kalidii]